MVILIILIWVIGWIEDEVNIKKEFKERYHVGDYYFSKKKISSFPAGKWIYRGKDNNDWYVYERIK